MLRSSRIPPLLNRICTDGILSSYLITIDGELLGCSNLHLQSTNKISPPTMTSPSSQEDNEGSSKLWENMDPSDIGALVAEVLEDYKRLGLELALLTPAHSGSKQTNSITSAGLTGGNGKELNAGGGKDKERGKLNCLIVEMEKGLIGISAASSDTYVVGLTDSTAQHGFLKMKLLSLSAHVRDSFLPLDKGSL